MALPIHPTVVMTVLAAYAGMGSMGYYAWTVYDRIQGLQAQDSSVQLAPGTEQMLVSANGTTQWMPLDQAACLLDVGGSILNTTAAIEQNITGIPTITATASGLCTSNDTIVTGPPLSGVGASWDPLGFATNLTGVADGAFVVFDGGSGEWTVGDAPCSLSSTAAHITGDGFLTPLDLTAVRADGSAAQAGDVLSLNGGSGEWVAAPLGQGVEVNTPTFGTNNGGTGTEFAFAADTTTTIGANPVFDGTDWVMATESNGGSFATVIRPVDNTQASLQAAIDAAAAAGGGRVYPRDALLSLATPLRLPSNVWLDCGGKALEYTAAPAVEFVGTYPANGFDVWNARLSGCTFVPGGAVAHLNVAVVGRANAGLSFGRLEVSDLHIGCPTAGAPTTPLTGQRGVWLEYTTAAAAGNPVSRDLLLKDITARGCAVGVEVHLDAAYLRASRITVYSGDATAQQEMHALALHGVETGPTIVDRVQGLHNPVDLFNHVATQGSTLSLAHTQRLLATNMPPFTAFRVYPPSKYILRNDPALASRGTTTGNRWLLVRGGGGDHSSSSNPPGSFYNTQDEAGGCAADNMAFSLMGGETGDNFIMQDAQCVHDVHLSAFQGYPFSVQGSAPNGAILSFNHDVRDLHVMELVFTPQPSNADLSAGARHTAGNYPLRTIDPASCGNLVLGSAYQQGGIPSTAGDQHVEMYETTGENLILWDVGMPETTWFRASLLHYGVVMVSADDATIIGGGRNAERQATFTPLSIPAGATDRDSMHLRAARTLALGYSVSTNLPPFDDGASASTVFRYWGTTSQTHSL